MLHIQIHNQTYEKFSNFVSSCVGQQRPIIVPYDTQPQYHSVHDASSSMEQHHNVHVNPHTQPPSHSTNRVSLSYGQDDSSHHPHKNAQSLEDELKQWLQQESGNWAEQSSTELVTNAPPNSALPTITPTTTSSTMETSLDKVFHDQEVNMSQLQLPKLKDNVQPSSTTTTPVPPATSPKGAYTNTMNSGDLGGGLSAFDGSDCAFATIS